MSFLDRIKAANTYNADRFRPFRVDNETVGFITDEFAGQLSRWPDVFQVDKPAVSLAPKLAAASASERTDSVDEVVQELRTEGVFGDHWWHERYAVSSEFHHPPALLLERAVLQHFGVCGYGVHLNGYVVSGGEVKVWVARRARNKPSGPGKLDQIVAGGQPAGIGLKQNMIKECAEEADMAPKLAGRVVPVGAISYCLETPYGLRPDVIYNFDIELPADFQPRNTDGEVEAFYLWPVEQVVDTVRDSDAFKFNCALVTIDFLLRHGFIEPEHPDYLQLVTGLHQRAAAVAMLA